MYQSKFEWKVREKTSEISDELVERFKLNGLEQTILENRGYCDESSLNDIFEPVCHSYEDIFEMDKAVDRINRAFQNDESILIYGDFDADGITSTAVLYDALLKKTSNVEYFIPNRITDGYGPNEQIFNEVVIGNFDLVITVDNGVSAAHEIAMLREHDIDVIIVDHHTFAAELPDAVIIHPAHPKGTYPFPHLAGVGITYKLTEALGLHEASYLGLAAVGTVADIVKMTGENKRIVMDGLKELNSDTPIGIKNLLRVGGHSGNIDEETIGFTIAPRLNAAGRLDDASIGVELLMTKDQGEAYESATEIESLNARRKDLVHQFYKEAEAQIKDEDVIIVYDNEWHPGVLGIVASRIADNYGKPVIALTLSEEGSYKGSARSIEGLDFLSLVKESGADYLNCGGHAGAFGIEVAEDSIEGFKSDIVEHVSQLDMDFKPLKNIDYAINQSNLTLKEFERFNRLKPFGHQFMTPLFMISNVKVRTLKRVGKDAAHIKMTLDGIDVDVIGFNFGHLAHEVSVGDDISIIGAVNVNEFNQERKLQMILQDIRMDQVQLLDMRSRATQDFSIISQNDYFLVSSGERRSDHYYYYGEALPFTMDTLILRDLPEDISKLKASLKGIHVSKIIMIFNSKEELYFSGIPNEVIMDKVFSLIGGADDGAINLMKHAPKFSEKLNISMKILKMAIDILEELGIISVENAIIYKKDKFQSIESVPLHDSMLMKNLLSRLDAESQLKMSSANEVKSLMKDMI
ncbi:single-stranded-DNA-specific exonuclease RecJ [Corticicoccus populi]|uniref:Single-stranded-DNA-specific exonuclease RecJ n=1 Tax=Corticicoccus populi TaxID=1812821 RepID=A0ABW5WWI2_9STAP